MPQVVSDALFLLIGCGVSIAAIVFICWCIWGDSNYDN